MPQASTQQFLEIKEIRDGVLVLNDGSIRGLLLVSSQNFALQSEEEQQATIYQFQSFLNSLDFSAQICIQSRKLNITGYIDLLKNLAQQQQNSLLKQQTEDYRAFVEQLISQGSIMRKSFYVSIPFYFGEIRQTRASKKSIVKSLFGGSAITSLSDEDFQRMKNQLWQRLEFVALGLRRTGLKAIPLNTEELIELFWSWHHPQEAEVGYYPELPPEVLT
ncbi:MAG: hypothetical protein Q8P39_02450 [Candidatus Yanofskybacteria bacterium]|nr:hypothetical protein [Candidatus Yanofskybacteria bacterium]